MEGGGEEGRGQNVIMIVVVSNQAGGKLICGYKSSEIICPKLIL